MWYSRAADIIIKIKHTKYYERKTRSNKVEYSTAVGVYCTTHDVKVPFCMPDFSNSKITNHRLHVYNEKGYSGIGYGMIICRDLMVQLGLTADFKRQCIQYDGVTVYMKEPSVLLGKSNLNKREIRKVVMQTSELYSTREATEILVKILNSTYLKAYLKQVAANATQLNSKERTQKLGSLKISRTCLMVL